MGTRLTRTELTWLLAQEARSAAHTLRRGVGLDASDSVPPPTLFEEGSGSVEGTLNRLDETVRMLASLHSASPPVRGRRGRIDLAALLWEVAPNARVQLTMGEGTLVLGDEGELRRMLQVLLGQAGDPASLQAAEVTLRREGAEIRLGVTLGPDKSPTFDMERAWLVRMAARYAGELHLDGNLQTLVLPAVDVNSERRELETLRRELTLARLQSEPPHRQSSIPGAPAPIALLTSIARAVGHAAKPPTRGSDSAGALSDVLSDLSYVETCRWDELPHACDVQRVVEQSVEATLPRANNRHVRVTIQELAAAQEVTNTSLLSCAIKLLLAHAITSSKAGDEVRVRTHLTDGGLELVVDDQGAPIHPEARKAVLSGDLGRLHSTEELLTKRAVLPLLLVSAVATHAGFTLRIFDAPDGGTRVVLSVVRGPM